MGLPQIAAEPLTTTLPFFLLEVIEHAPVQSTDRLEKPRRVPPPQSTATPEAMVPQFPGVSSATLPRRWGASNRIVIHDKGQFKLRRNGSLADLQDSPSPSTPPVNRRQLQMPPSGGAGEQRVQVPAHVVKSIVVSVLHQQGVPNPAEEILNAAIQEYYAKNPQGVSYFQRC